MTIVERSECSPVRLTDGFLKAIHAYLKEHLSDWADDYEDPAVLKTAVEQVLGLICNQISGSNIEIYRAELRPREQIASGDYDTLGSCWSWDSNGAAVCHHDNAYDQHGKDVLEVIFVAKASLSSIDWVQTLAKNLVLRNEREISLRDNSNVKVIDAWATKFGGGIPHNFEINIASSGDF